MRRTVRPSGCGGRGLPRGSRLGPERVAVLWVLCSSTLQWGCPQRLDDDFSLASAADDAGPAGDFAAVPEPDTVLPTVLASTPSQRARAVASDARIEITFSEPMDTRATEGAYVSGDLPAADVSFSWRADDTVLVIAPANPLSVASGTNLALIEAREYSLELTSDASDRAGNPLAPFELTFAVVRELVQVIEVNADRGSSGNWRSDESYGAEVCEETDTTICVGDSDAAGAPAYRGFASFDLRPLPSDRQAISAARLSLRVSLSFNDPFEALGALGIEKVRFSEIGTAAFQQTADAGLGTLSSAGGVGETLSADVASAVRADAALGLSQYRLRFERDNLDDGAPNVIVFDLESARLTVNCLVP